MGVCGVAISLCPSEKPVTVRPALTLENTSMRLISGCAVNLDCVGKP